MGKQASELTIDEYDELLVATIDALQPVYGKYDGTVMISIVTDLLKRCVQSYPAKYQPQLIAQITGHFMSERKDEIQ